MANDKTRLMTSRQLGALSSALLAQLILFMAKFYDTHEGKTHAKLAGHMEILARQQKREGGKWGEGYLFGTVVNISII